MSKELREDYEKLIQFIEGYTLSNSYNSDSFEKIVRPIHKVYFSSIVLFAELKYQQAQLPISLHPSEHSTQTQVFWDHLTECVSELGSSFFLIIHGCYKAAEQVLRSSIENFSKAVGSLDERDLNNLRNVHDLLNAVKNTPTILHSDRASEYAILVQKYRELCSRVHTGTIHDMQNISSLGDFPFIEEQSAKRAKRSYESICKNYLTILCTLFRGNFHKMHHRNKETIEHCLSRTALAKINAS